MNFSTKHVTQLYVLDTASAPSNIGVSGESVKLAITHADGSVEVTDQIEKVLSLTSVVAAADDVKTRKAALVEAKSGTVVAGQEYVLCVEFRDAVGQETSIQKFASYIVGAGEDEEDLYKALAMNLLKNSSKDVEPLFELYELSDANTIDDTKQITDNTATFTYGFAIVEATPTWKLGSFPERLADFTVSAPTVWVSGVETEWLDGDKAKVAAASDFTVPNSKELADLEYFCKGERGLSNGKEGWPDNIEPKLYIDSADATGYAILVAHYAYVGDGASNQKSERDAIFVTKEANKSNLTTIRTALAALPTIF